MAPLLGPANSDGRFGIGGALTLTALLESNVLPSLRRLLALLCGTGVAEGSTVIVSRLLALLPGRLPERTLSRSSLALSDCTGPLALRSRNCLGRVASPGGYAGTVGSFFTRTPPSSSAVKLLVCLSVGISSLKSSWVATTQSTSGGGGVGARVGIGASRIVPAMERANLFVSTTLYAKDSVGVA